jgi:hypothetical protein
MEENEVLNRLSDTATQKPIKLKIEIVNLSRWDRVLVSIGLKKKYREFEIKPLVYGKLIQISSLILSFGAKLVIINREEYKDGAYSMANDHGIKLAEIIAIAISKERYPSPSLRKFILDNLTVPELFEVVKLVTGQLEVNSFLSSIILLTGINVLKSEVSPLESVETIARTGLSAAS